MQDAAQQNQQHTKRKGTDDTMTPEDMLLPAGLLVQLKHSHSNGHTCSTTIMGLTYTVLVLYTSTSCITSLATAQSLACNMQPPYAC